jgi:hypothetical protein
VTSLAEQKKAEAPTKKTLKNVMAKRIRKYSRSASGDVKGEMHRYKRGAFGGFYTGRIFGKRLGPRAPCFSLILSMVLCPQQRAARFGFGGKDNDCGLDFGRLQSIGG